ncbi:unnamed protein product [Cylindrotheca closterium]|uniref:G-protein coupled receptors family 3 profile domain-containing protein n=1 Tax=Cylindrotheca closterium TaxID=2856 RepID=A0AAD2JP02_9STRA|nr:unnamed protein product [Cylindrotheca closterium]
MIIHFLSHKANAQRECVSDIDCAALYRQGSTCLASGQCSNPFIDGCLKSMKPQSEDQRIRLCNSDDDTAEERNCRTSPLNYPEIRIHNQDWEAAIFFSWIIQISLMEFLDVPVTIGVGRDTQESSFYHIENNLPFSSTSYSWDGIRKANELGGNCLLTDEDCVNLITDVWASQVDVMAKEYADGQLDNSDGNGQVEKLSWWVPKYTAVRYPFTVTHLGLSQNHHRVAEIFKRPTAWGDYCNEVSPNNCTVPDGVAEMYPNQDDAGKYFASGYIGHFRATAENNCTGVVNNNTCTGHVVAPPCTWSTFIETQTYWLDLALKSSGPSYVNGGYTYSEMIQIWNAANATQSDVMMQWAEPDTVVEVYRNTGAEFTKVYLPTPSLQCEAARPTTEERCSEDPVVRRGTMAGACDNSAHITKKAIAISLRDSTLALPPAEQSPAYSFIQNFNIDQLHINEMLSHYGAGGRTGYAAREAVCTWIANNTEYLQRLMPPNHPKVFQSRDEHEEIATILAYSLGFVALVYILLSTTITFRKRKTAVFVYAQAQFVFVILFGLLLVAVGAILHGMEPDDVICCSRIGLVSLGYTFQLVALIVKVTALNGSMKASQQRRRVKINPSQLYTSVMILSLLLGFYLIIWMAVDPPKSTEIWTQEPDSITVTSHFGCRSESQYWHTAYIVWEGMLVLWASAVAFQTRHIEGEFNESTSLGMMSYSHFVFLMIRVMVSVVFEGEDHTRSLATSVLLSVDIIAAITIYLVPKMVSSGCSIQELGSRSRLSFSGSFQAVVGTNMPLVPITEKPQRFTSGATASMSSFSGMDRISMLSGAEETESHAAGGEESKANPKSPSGGNGLHGKQAALNQMHPRSSVSHWATGGSTESLNTSNGGSPIVATQQRKQQVNNHKPTPATDNGQAMAALKQQIWQLKKSLVRKDEENEDLQQMILFLQDTQTAQEEEIQRLSVMNT